MSIKLVAIDLDDTLLNSRHRISDECMSAIYEARRQGVIVTLATGRMFRAALPYAKQLKMDLPLITYQGALVKHSFSGEVLYYRAIDRNLLTDIMHILNSEGIYYHIYCADNLYVRDINEDVRSIMEVTGVSPVVTAKYELLLDTTEVLEVMAVINDEETLLKMERKLKVMFTGQLHINRFKDCYLEIMQGQATKARALEFIAGYYNIEQHEVMAIGDGYNDIPMIEWAGIGVAMGNAEQEVKDLADYVTLSNDEMGVAEALRNLVLK